MLDNVEGNKPLGNAQDSQRFGDLLAEMRGAAVPAPPPYPQVDPSTIRRFLEVLFKRVDLALAAKGYVALRGFEHFGKKKAILDGFHLCDRSLPGRIATSAGKMARRTGAEAAVFSPPVCLFGDKRIGGRLTASEFNVICCPVIVLELDDNPKAMLARAVEILGKPPTMIVNSGGVWQGPDGPEDKLHAYWRLTEPAVEPEQREALKRVRLAMSMICGGDGTAAPLSHPLRIPGSWHTKSTPRLCTIAAIDDAAEIDLAEAVDRCERAAAVYNVDLTKGPTPASAPRREGFKTPTPLHAAALQAYAKVILNPPEMPWDQWNVVGMALFDASYGSEDGRKAFHTFSEKNSRYEPDDVDHRWDHFHKSPPSQVSEGKLLYLAQQADPKFVPPFDIDLHYDKEAGAAATLADEAQSAPGLFPAAECDVFELLSLGQIINQTPPRYLIDRHVPEASLGFLYGDPSSGKSFITLDWALTIAFGKPTWHGDVITADPDAYVLYLAGEGQSGFRARIRAWAKYHGIPDADIDGGRFRMIGVSVELMKSEQVGKLIRSLYQLPGRVCLVIVDTVSRAMPGAEENLQKDMTLFVAACDRIKREFNCTVLGVHHTNKEGEMRGSTVLMGAGDFVLKLARDTKPANTTLRTLQCMKMKDGPDGWREQYQFDVVAIEDGSSLVPARRVADSVPAIEMPAGLAAQVLAAMDAAWKSGEPWAKTRRAKNDRYAGLQMARKFDLDTEAAEAMLKAWRDAGMIELAVYDTNRKTEGYRVLTYTAPPAVSGTDPEGIFG